MNLTQFAKKIGISQPRASALVKDGTLKKSIKKVGREYEINFKEGKAELQGTLDQGRKVKAKIGGKKNRKVAPRSSAKDKKEISQQAKTDGFDFHTARSLNEQYKAALKKLEFDQRRGKLVDIDEVKRIGFEAAKQFKEHALAIPDRVAAIVAATSDPHECKQILLKEISLILENLSDALRKIT